EEPPDSGQSQESPLTDEQMRAQLEEELRKVRVEDVVLQSVVSILNLSARRIAKDDERDLDQARVGIDAATALLPLVSEEAQPQLRQAISELQLLFAQHAGGGESGPSDGGDDEGGGDGEPEPKKPPEQGKPETGSSQGGSGLWTPP